MSSGAEGLTKERKITVKTYIKNKIHTLRVYRKFTDKNYAIWVKMIDLQIRLCHRNLTKKIKNFCGAKYPTKEQVKKYKRKANAWDDDYDNDDDDDDKSVYIREDLAYRIIRYTNLGVIEADEFRKNLGIKNGQSIRIEREITATKMKIFEKENMVRQYQIPGVRCLADLCFVDHKLVIEIDQDGHSYYENDATRQNLIENLGFTFIRINPDPNPNAGFDLDAEIAKIYN